MNEIFADNMFFGGAITLIVCMIGALIKKKLKWMNILIFAVIVLIILLKVFGISYETYDNGAKYITYLLTPVTVVLAVPLYRQLTILKNNAKEILIGIFAGMISNMAGVFGLALLFGLSHEEYATLLPKSVTTAIGMGISEEFGGIVTITIAVIMITGMIGNVFGELILKMFRVRNPIAKGVAIGTCSHAFGTMKALEMGEVEGAMSSLSVVVAGLMTVITVSLFANLI